MRGRGEQFGTIGEAIDLAPDGTGSFVLVEGPAGIGKTTLLDAAAAVAAEQGFLVLSARGHEGESGLPYGGARQLVDGPLRGDPRLSELAFEGTGRLARPVISAGLDLGEQPDTLEDPFVALHGLYWVCSNLSAEHPLLIAVDDVHWLDQASGRFISYLAARVGDLPIVLVAAARTGAGTGRELVDSLSGTTGATLLALDPLGADDAGAIVREICGTEADDEFCAACREVTGGNPFLLEELARSAVADGLPATVESVSQIEALTPAAVVRSVSARLGRLGADAQKLAEVIAVIGSDAEIRLAAELAGQEPDRAFAAADELARDELIVGASRLAFVHPLIRSAVLERIGPGEMTRLHEAAAALLLAAGDQSEHAAMHLLSVSPANDPARVALLIAAGEKAAARGAPDAAVEYLRRALEEPPAEADRARVLFDLGRYGAMTVSQESLGHLIEAVDLTADAEERVEMLSATAYAAASNFGLFQDAQSHLERALASIADPESETALVLRAEHATWAALDASKARPLVELEKIAGHLEGDTPGERGLLAVLAWSRMGAGRPPSEVVPAAQRALGGGKLVSEHGSASLMTLLAIWPLAYALAVEEFEPELGFALAAATREGSRHGVAIHAGAAGIVALLRGRLRDAEAYARQALEAALEVSSIGAAGAVAIQTSARVGLGESDLAWADVERLGFAGDLPPIFPFTVLMLSRGRLRAARGDLEGALADATLAGSIFDRWGVMNPAEAPWRSDAAAVHLKRGSADRARALLEEELRLARDAEVPHAVGHALRLLGLCARGSDGIEVQREAISVLEGTEARLELARARIDLGASLRRANHRGDQRAPLEEARELLRTGIDSAHSSGATPLVEHGQAELRATGSRPRRVMLTGAEALTASERRAGDLAAEGLTNREIAETLFVSLKTVEKHLGNCYAKLDISGRKELARALKADRA